MLRGVANLSSLKGVLIAKNTIDVSDNITSSGQVKGATVSSTGRMTTDKFFRINETATAGASSSPNGVVGRKSQAGLLSCEPAPGVSPGVSHIYTIIRVQNMVYQLLGKMSFIPLCTAMKITGRTAGAEFNSFPMVRG